MKLAEEIERIKSELGDIPCKTFYGKTVEEIVMEIIASVTSKLETF